MEFWGYFAAVVMGLLLGLVGGGGSILTVPILVYFFNQDSLEATTGSLFIVGSIAFVGAILGARQGLVDFRRGIIFTIPSFAGVYLSRQIILPSIPDSPTKSQVILLSFAFVMIFAATSMIRSGKNISRNEKPVQQGLLFIGMKGLLVGCVTGFVGAGGGFLIVPSLILFLHLPMRNAIGTSLAIITANSLFGFIISQANQVNWSLLITITFIGIIGLVVGNRLHHRFDESRLKRSFGYFVLVIGILTLTDQIIKIAN